MSSYIVVHVCCAEGKHSVVVRKLLLVDDGAVVGDMGTIVDRVCLGVYVFNTLDPVPRLLGPVGSPLGIRFVVGISGQSGSQIEETAVGDGYLCQLQPLFQGSKLTVLVVVAVVGEGNLPPQSSTARVIMSTRGRLGVENGLCEGKPARLVVGGVGKPVLGRQHGRHAPESLVIISQRERYVIGLVVFVVADLVQHGFYNDVVVTVVACERPVVDHGAPKRTALPPVVIASRGWAW